MIPRYTRPEMAAIWSPETRFRIWFEIEAHAADAMAEAGEIPRGAARIIRERGEAAQFETARIDHIDVLIAPALDRGAWVVSDRFIDSTRAYQGVAGDLDPDFISRLEQVAVGERRPDLTLVLDLAPEKGLARAALRRGASFPCHSTAIVFLRSQKIQ